MRVRERRRLWFGPLVLFFFGLVLVASAFAAPGGDGWPAAGVGAVLLLGALRLRRSRR